MKKIIRRIAMKMICKYIFSDYSDKELIDEKFRLDVQLEYRINPNVVEEYAIIFEELFMDYELERRGYYFED